MLPGAVVLLLGLWPGSSSAVQGPTQALECADWRACRDATEDALAANDTESAHDLAWRAVQRGPRDDAALMFLLARAQARSGRVDDALVMVRRLAQRGVATEAATHPDLERVRGLADWAAVAPLVASAGEGTPPPTPEPPLSAAARRSRRGAPAVAAAADATAGPAGETAAPDVAPPPAAAAAEPASRDAATAVRTSNGAVEEALRFSAEPFRAGGLAYDAVSHRFLLGDRDGRKLRVAAEGLTAAVDLVREQSAGFHDVRAVEIDATRGDLWVASADAAGGAATLHKLQLISGRPLHAYPVSGSGEVRLADLGVAADGTIVTLDDAGRVYRLKPGADTVARVASLEGGAATSLALAGRGNIAYVAHADGLARVDLGSGVVVALTAPPDVPLTGLERVRAHRGGLAAIQAQPDGLRRVVRLELTASGRAVRRATRFDASIAAEAGPVFAVVVGDDLAFVTTESALATNGDTAEFVVRRVRLR